MRLANVCLAHESPNGTMAEETTPRPWCLRPLVPPVWRRRLVFQDLRQNERFFPDADLHDDAVRQAFGFLPRQCEPLILRLYERLADAERLCAPLVFTIII